MIWEKYKKSNNYIEENQIVDNANWFWDMYLGNQWEGAKVRDYSKLPVMNFTKQVVDYKTAAIGQNQMTVVFSDTDTEKDAVMKLLNRYWSQTWEREDMDPKMYSLIQQSGIQGDGYLYFGKKNEARLLPDSSLLFADEQNPDIQTQEYIMIRIRPFVKDVKDIARKNGVDEADIATIHSDTKPDYLVGNKNDINYDSENGKVTAVIYFEKKDGVVYMARATEYCEYEPLHALSLVQGEETLHGSSLYPIAKYTCENVPNSARGRGWVQDVIPNQIELNKTYARASRAIQHTAYPRIAYDSNSIMNPEALDETGSPIEVEGDAQSISSKIAYLQSVPMSGDVFNYMENMITTTKQVVGASDAITGISDPTRVSGSAISEIREQSTLTLKGNVINLKQTYEDIARIRLDMWQTYYPDGVDVTREPTAGETEMIKNGEEVNLNEHIDGEMLRSLIPDITIDVSLQTQATKDGTQAILDNNLEKGYITYPEWVDASDEGGNVPKHRLQKILDARKNNPQIDNNTGQPIQQDIGQNMEQDIQPT